MFARTRRIDRRSMNYIGMLLTTSTELTRTRSGLDTIDSICEARCTLLLILLREAPLRLVDGQ